MSGVGEILATQLVQVPLPTTGADPMPLLAVLWRGIGWCVILFRWQDVARHYCRSLSSYHAMCSRLGRFVKEDEASGRRWHSVQLHNGHYGVEFKYLKGLGKHGPSRTAPKAMLLHVSYIHALAGWVLGVTSVALQEAMGTALRPMLVSTALGWLFWAQAQHADTARRDVAPSLACCALSTPRRRPRSGWMLAHRMPTRSLMMGTSIPACCWRSRPPRLVTFLPLLPRPHRDRCVCVTR